VYIINQRKENHNIFDLFFWGELVFISIENKFSAAAAAVPSGWGKKFI